MANFCSKCGKTVNSDAAFCSSCGANLQTVEVNNAVNNDNLQNSSNNDSLTSKNCESNQVTTPTVAQDKVNNTASEQLTNNQTDTKYEEIELPNLLENLEKIELGKNFKIKGYAFENPNELDVINLYSDNKGNPVFKDCLIVDLNSLSEEVRKDICLRLKIAKWSKGLSFQPGYLDITIEGQVKEGKFTGNYLEADEVYYDKSLAIKISEKKRWVAFLLTIFFGWIGLGRFYLGHYLFGILETIISFVFLCMGIPIWIVDAFYLAPKLDVVLKDGKGNYIL